MNEIKQYSLLEKVIEFCKDCKNYHNCDFLYETDDNEFLCALQPFLLQFKGLGLKEAKNGNKR